MMKDVRSFERTLRGQSTVEQNPHQICRPLSLGALRRADGQSFDPGSGLFRPLQRKIKLQFDRSSHAHRRRSRRLNTLAIEDAGARRRFATGLHAYRCAQLVVYRSDGGFSEAL